MSPVRPPPPPPPHPSAVLLPGLGCGQGLGAGLPRSAPGGRARRRFMEPERRPRRTDWAAGSGPGAGRGRGWGCEEEGAGKRAGAGGKNKLSAPLGCSAIFRPSRLGEWQKEEGGGGGGGLFFPSLLPSRRPIPRKHIPLFSESSSGSESRAFCGVYISSCLCITRRHGNESPWVNRASREGGRGIGAPCMPRAGLCV